MDLRTEVIALLPKTGENAASGVWKDPIFEVTSIKRTFYRLDPHGKATPTQEQMTAAFELFVASRSEDAITHVRRLGEGTLYGIAIIGETRIGYEYTFEPKKGRCMIFRTQSDLGFQIAREFGDLMEEVGSIDYASRSDDVFQDSGPYPTSRWSQ